MLGSVRGVVTDVSSADSVEALAEDVFAQEGACHLLFNNAGVTSGGGGRPWEQEPNDWTWCFSVNVFGVANGMLSFVPRMIASGEPGVVDQHLEHGRRHRPGPVRVGLRLEQGGHLVPDRGVGPPAHRRRHRAAGCRLLSLGGPARHRAVDRPAQPARGAAADPTPPAGARHDLRGVQGATRGGGSDRRDHGPARAGPLLRATASSGATSSSATGSRRQRRCCTAGPTPSAPGSFPRPR